MRSRRGGVSLNDYEKHLLAEIEAECRESDPVASKVVFHQFVSRSKGWRNGKQRIRKKWKEVELVKYGDHFQSWHRFPFDVHASEILGYEESHGKWASEILQERIRGAGITHLPCNYNLNMVCERGFYCQSCPIFKEWGKKNAN